MATVELTEENFESVIKDNDVVLVDFWAQWCGPCKTFGPIFEEVSELYPDAVFGKVNTEEQPALAGYFQIRSIPTLMVFRDQIGVFSQPGALPQEALVSLLDQVSELDMDEIRAEIESEERVPQS